MCSSNKIEPKYYLHYTVKYMLESRILMFMCRSEYLEHIHHFYYGLLFRIQIVSHGFNSEPIHAFLFLLVILRGMAGPSA